MEWWNNFGSKKHKLKIMHVNKFYEFNYILAYLFNYLKTI